MTDRLDFEPLRRGEMTLETLGQDLTKGNLAALTNEMIDRMLELIGASTDADVIYVPEDPDADDPYASSDAERDLAWTLGHVIVHTTASAEESAFLAAELARGVENHGRSRYEVPWRMVTTIEQCRQRLQESRRMRLASLELWPDPPHLDNLFQSRMESPAIGPVGYFLLGLLHDDDHLGQIEKIARQARAARMA